MAANVNIIVNAKDNTKGVLSKVGGALGDIAKTAAGFISAQIFQKLGSQVVDFAKSSVSAASDLNETLSKTQVLFGDAAEPIIRWSQDMASAFGQSQKQALDAASTFAIFGKGAGLSGLQLSHFSASFTQLASDMASFFNTSPEDAITAIGAAFRGETEPIRRYGVLLDDASLRQKALELGIVKTTKNALTPQQKVLAASQLILEQTADAQGDFERTSDGLANQQRILAATIENTKAELGTAFLPVLTDVLGLVTTVGIPKLGEFIDQFKEIFQRVTKAGEAFAEGRVGEGITRLGNIFEEFGLPAGKFEEIIGQVQTVLEPIGQWFEDNLPLIKDTGNNILEAFGSVWTKFVEDIWPTLEPVLGMLATVLLDVVNAVAQLIAGDVDGWSQSLTDAADTVVKAFGGESWAGVKETWQGNWDALLEIGDKVIKKIKEFAKNIITNLIEGLKDNWQSVIDWLRDALAGAFGSLFPGLGGGGSGTGAAQSAPTASAPTLGGSPVTSLSNFGNIVVNLPAQSDSVSGLLNDLAITMAV